MGGDAGSSRARSPLCFALNILAQILFLTRFLSFAERARYASTSIPQTLPSLSTPSKSATPPCSSPSSLALGSQ
jgi:hypothetical protein